MGFSYGIQWDLTGSKGILQIPPHMACYRNVAVAVTVAIFEGSLETKVPTIWTDEKHSQEEAEPGRNSDV